MNNKLLVEIPSFELTINDQPIDSKTMRAVRRVALSVGRPSHVYGHNRTILFPNTIDAIRVAEQLIDSHGVGYEERNKFDGRMRLIAPAMNVRIMTKPRLPLGHGGIDLFEVKQGLRIGKVFSDFRDKLADYVNQHREVAVRLSLVAPTLEEQLQDIAQKIERTFELERDAEADIRRAQVELTETLQKRDALLQQQESLRREVKIEV